MSTSGTSVFNPTRDQIVNGALRMVGAYASSDKPRPEQFNDALEALNMMLKSWQIDGYLWLRCFAYLWLVRGQHLYELGTGSTDHCTTSYNSTTTTVSYPATTTTIAVSDSTSMTAGDYIGIYLDDLTIHWTTVVSKPSTTSVTITSGLASQATTGATVITYTSKIDRPTKIYDATRMQATGYEVPVTKIARGDYQMLPNKTTIGKPVQFYYDPQMVLGKLYVWPASDVYTERLVIHCDRPIQDITGDGDTFDVPQEWMETIKYGLAVRIAHEYGVPGSDYTLLMQQFQLLKQSHLEYDTNSASTFFTVGR